MRQVRSKEHLRQLCKKKKTVILYLNQLFDFTSNFLFFDRARAILVAATKDSQLDILCRGPIGLQINVSQQVIVIPFVKLFFEVVRLFQIYRPV